MNWVFQTYSEMHGAAFWGGARRLTDERGRYRDGEHAAPLEGHGRVDTGESVLARLVRIARENLLQHRPTAAR